MIIIDSSVWIASINKAERRHNEAQDLLKKVSNPEENEYGDVWIPWFVSQETFTRVLYYKSIEPKSKILDSLRKQFNYPQILNENKLDTVVFEKIFRKTFNLMKRSSENQNSPSFIDCYQVELANELAKTISSTIYLAYFDQWFPNGDYIPVFKTD